MANIQAFLKDTFDAAEKSARPNQMRMEVNLVTNQKSGVCSYATGMVNFVPGRTNPRPAPRQFVSREPLQQVFSDRKRLTNTPFSPFDADALGLVIAHNAGTDVINVTLTLLSKGNKKIAFEAEVINGILLGYAPAAGVPPSRNTNPVFLISLSKLQGPPQ
jgi:hypothetical protein